MQESVKELVNLKHSGASGAALSHWWQEHRVLPLGVWLIVLVSLMLDHPVAADSNVRPRHFHPI